MPQVSAAQVRQPEVGARQIRGFQYRASQVGIPEHRVGEVRCAEIGERQSRIAQHAVGEVLNKWPQLKIEIDGHTDSRGSDAYNLGLSRRRAAAVRVYLLDHFPHLRPEQLTTKGYGESKPLVPNTSPANMAQNRRVEFTVLNKEVLKQLKP